MCPPCSVFFVMASVKVSLKLASICLNNLLLKVLTACSLHSCQIINNEYLAKIVQCQIYLSFSALFIIHYCCYPINTLMFTYSVQASFARNDSMLMSFRVFSFVVIYVSANIMNYQKKNVEFFFSFTSFRMIISYYSRNDYSFLK